MVEIGNKLLEFYNQGETYYAEDDLDRALSSYRSALELDEEMLCSSIIHFRLGRIFSKKGNHIAAIEEFRKSLDDAPVLKVEQSVKDQLVQAAYFNLGISLSYMVNKGDKNYELGEAEEYLKKVSENPIAGNQLKIIELMKKRGWVDTDEVIK